MYYFITYSVSEMGLTEIAAGQIYGISMGLRDRRPDILGMARTAACFRLAHCLCFLSFSMFAATAALGLATPEWGAMGP